MARSVAERVRALREQRGWSQQQLSKVSGISSRTIQRIEGGAYEPQPQTLQALAAVFDVDVSKLRTGFAAEELASFERDFLCPTCGSELQERTLVEHEYGDADIEIFGCGHMRGLRSRPCPKDPRFPKFEDYELRFHPDGDRWSCYAMGKTEAAREVELLNGSGDTKQEAAEWVKRSYIHASEGYEAAQEFMPL